MYEQIYELESGSLEEKELTFKSTPYLKESEEAEEAHRLYIILQKIAVEYKCRMIDSKTKNEISNPFVIEKEKPKPPKRKDKILPKNYVKKV